MPFIKHFFLLIVLTGALIVSAQDELTFETVNIPAGDELMLVGDLYLPETHADEGNPAVLLLHMLGSHRGAYTPLIPDLLDNGYVVLNVDMRGHGDTGGSRDWELAIEDVQVWLNWLREQDGVAGDPIAIIGGSIGSNVALIACANDETCVTAIALSPGLDYAGVQPEASVIDGLSERSALLVAAHGDGYSADSVRQMFAIATGDISARIYGGSSHGTNLLRTNYASISHLILSWLAEHLTGER